MKTRKNYKAIEVMNRNELTLVKGGEDICVIEKNVTKQKK